MVKAPQHLTTDGKAKFDGSSTAKEAYKSWQLPPRYKPHRAEYNPSQAGFDGTTTYKNTYIPKQAGMTPIYLFFKERYVHPTPTYVPNVAKFEGQSTNKTDYLLPGNPKRAQDFRPRNVYQYVADDRDFLSTTRGQHTPKPLPHCMAADWVAQGIEASKDGHVNLK